MEIMCISFLMFWVLNIKMIKKFSATTTYFITLSVVLV